MDLPSSLIEYRFKTAGFNFASLTLFFLGGCLPLSPALKSAALTSAFVFSGGGVISSRRLVLEEKFFNAREQSQKQVFATELALQIAALEDALTQKYQGAAPQHPTSPEPLPHQESTPPAPPSSTQQHPAPSTPPAPPSASPGDFPALVSVNSPEISAEERSRVLELKKRGYGMEDIILEVWQVKKGGNLKYQMARDKYKTILSDAGFS